MISNTFQILLKLNDSNNDNNKNNRIIITLPQLKYKACMTLNII